MSPNIVSQHRKPGSVASRQKHYHTIPPMAPLLLRLFTAYSKQYLRRAFHAIRLAPTSLVRVPDDMPLMVYCNHPSWWDPLVCFFLAQRLFPQRRHYAPMAAQALQRYRFFTRLGFFGVDTNSARGAGDFLHLGQTLLTQPGTALWLTPEGTFTDPRQRPVRIQPGIGHLVRRLERGVVLPLALEYPFWQERFPEVLGRFGRVISLDQEPPRRAREWTDFLAARLEETQNALARDACTRRSEVFDVVLRGRAGVGGVYDWWRAWRAVWRGERFQKAHGDEG